MSKTVFTHCYSIAIFDFKQVSISWVVLRHFKHIFIFQFFHRMNHINITSVMEVRAWLYYSFFMPPSEEKAVSRRNCCLQNVELSLEKICDGICLILFLTCLCSCNSIRRKFRTEYFLHYFLFFIFFIYLI